MISMKKPVREAKKVSLDVILRKIPEEEKILEAVNLFDAFSDPTRLKIVLALMEGELCTHEISKVVGISISAASHQLRILRDRRIVSFSRRGRHTFYRLADEHIRKIIEMVIGHLGE
ncbi:MAG: ArsR/SmtB family transcription factor [Candidatus Asgardarchaeia archaeon]